MQGMHPIQTAADLAGGLGALARALGVSYQATKFWLDDARTIEPARCVQIERITEGAVRRWDLRPHDWGAIWLELIGAEGAPHWPIGEVAA